MSLAQGVYVSRPCPETNSSAGCMTCSNSAVNTNCLMCVNNFCVSQSAGLFYRRPKGRRFVWRWSTVAWCMFIIECRSYTS
ncbi:Uncharacterized protein APZ42_013283 [Daphnia magna]|uniref:Uncharacterized protein n=1 Tax=Daphnia magna TaxID=35525 RepID=A0A0P6G527_9CRUS|nr:Uncharacterized protein APZ42_013283 [Daphnia magna]